MNSSCERIPVLVIFAPTAAGKTALALDLFGTGSSSFFKERAELISADSMQVYRGMDIGTAKPYATECNILPHHLINLYAPDIQYSAADFVTLADACCTDIWSRRKLPIVVGGTGFYIQNFLLGLPPTPASDEKIRKSLIERVKAEGTDILYEELLECDPASAAVIHPNDAYRICRALEIYRTTGKPRSSFLCPSELRTNYDFCIIELVRNRDDLYRRIDERVDDMFRRGLADEVRSLRNAGYTAEDPGMRAIGYREWFSASDEQTVAEMIKEDSHRYAKKQYTYMKDIPGAELIPFDGSGEAVNIVRNRILFFLQCIHLT